MFRVCWVANCVCLYRDLTICALGDYTFPSKKKDNPYSVYNSLNINAFIRESYYIIIRYMYNKKVYYDSIFSEDFSKI